MFKSGDKVIRIAASKKLTVGATYEVLYSYGNCIQLKGIDSTWDSINFKLAAVQQLPEKWAIRGCPELREYMKQISHIGGDTGSVYFIENGRWKCDLCFQSDRIIISFDSFIKSGQFSELIPLIPERWYIETQPGPDRDFVGAFYVSKVKHNVYYSYSVVSSHNNRDESIFNANRYTFATFSGNRGEKITIEQFKQLVNNHQNNNNNGNKNNEVQRNAESIGNTNSGGGITAQSRKCTIAIANGYVGNAFSNKPSKATIIQNRVTGNILVASHN